MSAAERIKDEKTLRDEFAALAMASMLTGVVGRIGAAQDIHAYATGPCNAVIVERAYAIADVMMKQREK